MDAKRKAEAASESETLAMDAMDARGKKRLLDETENSSSSGSVMEEDIAELLSSESESESEGVLKVPSNVKPSVLLMGMRDFNSFGLTLEVFSVQFVDRNQVKPEDMYGELALSWHFCDFVFFERYLGDPPPIIDAEGFLKFTGPNTWLSGSDHVDFVACLHRVLERPNLILERPNLNVHPKLWSSFWYDYLEHCDKLLSKTLETNFGPVKIDYAVFDAAPSVLEVKLLDWKDEGKHDGTGNEIEVFGSVTARTKLIRNDRAKSYMFQRDENMCALVRPGEAIPLSRRIICFPYKWRAVLEVNLSLRHRSGNDSSLGGVDLIEHSLAVSPWQNCVEFDLEGVFARLQVKITDYYSTLKKRL